MFGVVRMAYKGPFSIKNGNYLYRCVVMLTKKDDSVFFEEMPVFYSDKASLDELELAEVNAYWNKERGWCGTIKEL